MQTSGPTEGSTAGGDDAFGTTEAFTLVSGGDVENPYAEFAEFRRNDPVAKLQATPVQIKGRDMEIYTAYRFDDIDGLLRDPDRFSSTTYSSVTGPVMGRTILEMDPPEHTEQRALVAWAFRKRGLLRWTDEMIRPKANELVDRFLDRGHAELMSEFCVPFPVQVIAGILGLPAEDYPRFLHWAMMLISWAGDVEGGLRASRELAEYFGAILDERRVEPREDLISDLAAADVDGERLDDEQIFSFLRLLITAGSETTARSFANLLVGLLLHPDQMAAVRADRSLVRVAIEEALRWEPPLTFIQRLVMDDVELSGCPVGKGSVVSTCLGSANRDETKFDHPDEFDISRGIPQHLSFGSGPHMCLGQQLRAVEMEVALETVLDRLPDLRIDPDAAPPVITGMVFRSPPRLDVVFGT